MPLFLILVFCALLLGAIFYTIERPKPAPDPLPQNGDGGFAITLSPEDRPEFKRTYKKKLDARCTIKVDIYVFYGSHISESGELTQPDGRWVLFDPRKVADKIIDPVLVSLVQKACDEILALDAAFRANLPDEFTDDGGVKWKRAK